MTDAADTTATQARILTRADGATIAYHRTPGRTPGVVFLTGFRSNMTGIKATYLEDFCRREGRAFVRFDYFGHGASSGDFLQGTIGRWAEDAMAVLDALTEGPQVLVGSSIGGWIMTLAALGRPGRVAGLVGIAAAPDGTADRLPARMTAAQRAELERDGVTHLPSAYGDGPYPITRRLLEEGRRHLVLQGPIPLTCPVRLIHGLADEHVPWSGSQRLAECLQSADVELILVKNGDHRLSEPADLERLGTVLAALLRRIDDQPSDSRIAFSPSR